MDVSYSETNVYTADGNLVGSYKYLYAYPDSGIALQSTADGVFVYACNIEVHPEGYLFLFSDNKYQLIDFAGNVLITDADSISYTEPGYFITQVHEDGYVKGYHIYDLSGRKLNEALLPYRYNRLVYTNDSDRVFVIETGEEIPVDGYPRELCGSLIRIDSVVYDVITGKVVLEDVDASVATGSELFIWYHDAIAYTRYTAEFKPAQ